MATTTPTTIMEQQHQQLYQQINQNHQYHHQHQHHPVFPLFAASFQELRDSWEEVSLSSSSTMKAGNTNNNNNSKSAESGPQQQHQHRLELWQQQQLWQAQQRKPDARQLYYSNQMGNSNNRGEDGDDSADSPFNKISSFSSGSSSSTSSSTSGLGLLAPPSPAQQPNGNPTSKELHAFLSSPTSMNWEDLVRSMVMENEKQKRRAKKAHKKMMRLGGGVNHCNNHEGMESNMNAEQWGEYDYEAEDEFDDESSMEDPELMNRTIIVPNFLLNNGFGGYDDDISDMGDSYFYHGTRVGDVGISEDENGPNDITTTNTSLKLKKKKKNLERLIERVVTGNIVIDNSGNGGNDEWVKKIERVVTEQRQRLQMQQRQQRQQRHHRLLQLHQQQEVETTEGILGISSITNNNSIHDNNDGHGNRSAACDSSTKKKPSSIKSPTSFTSFSSPSSPSRTTSTTASTPPPSRARTSSITPKPHSSTSLIGIKRNTKSLLKNGGQQQQPQQQQGKCGGNGLSTGSSIFSPAKKEGMTKPTASTTTTPPISVASQSSSLENNDTSLGHHRSHYYNGGGKATFFVGWVDEKGNVVKQLLENGADTTYTNTDATAARNTVGKALIAKEEEGSSNLQRKTKISSTYASGSSSSATSTADTTVTALPIIIRLESLALHNDKRSPTCWQRTRHRMRKTRGEF